FSGSPSPSRRGGWGVRSESNPTPLAKRSLPLPEAGRGEDKRQGTEARTRNGRAPSGSSSSPIRSASSFTGHLAGCADTIFTGAGEKTISASGPLPRGTFTEGAARRRRFPVTIISKPIFTVRGPNLRWTAPTPASRTRRRTPGRSPTLLVEEAQMGLAD